MTKQEREHKNDDNDDDWCFTATFVHMEVDIKKPKLSDVTYWLSIINVYWAKLVTVLQFIIHKKITLLPYIMPRYTTHATSHEMSFVYQFTTYTAWKTQSQRMLTSKYRIILVTKTSSRQMWKCLHKTNYLLLKLLKYN